MRFDELYPSKWLKAADVTRPILAVMKSVSLEAITEDDNKPVLHFAGDLKPLVLNKTNGAIIAGIYGQDVSTWAGKQIVLYADKTNFRGEVVDCVRCRAAKGLKQPEPEHDDVPF